MPSNQEFQWLTILKSATVARPGFATGSTINRSILNTPPPSIFAASSISLGMERRKFMSSIMLLTDSTLGNTNDQIEFSMPSFITTR